jgi:predicted nucleic acid-binding protein
MKKTYVLDANAALDFLEGGPGVHRVKQLLKDALEERIRILMSVANLGEVFYHVWPLHGEEGAKRAIGELVLMSVQPVDVDMPQALKAAEIKSRHKIPYVDCLAAALAALRSAILVTGDHDFEKLGRHADVLWTHRK